MDALLLPAAGGLALLGLVLLVAGGRRLRRGRWFGGALGTTTGLLLVVSGALCLVLSMGLQGYRALTREETALLVETRPTGPQRFEARVTTPDGRVTTFQLAGDELYVDAHILKWKPLANLLGVHTAYELDRVAGRYTALEDEQAKPRTVFSLAAAKRIDLFALRRRFAWLDPLVDATYGSATFIAAREPGRCAVLVSTTGLLVRLMPAGADR
jgi:hypothetical protein